MPYSVKQVSGKGYQCTTPNHPGGFSKKSMSKRKASAQCGIIKRNTNESYITKLQQITMSADQLKLIS